MPVNDFLNSVGGGLGWKKCPHCHETDSPRQCVRCRRDMCASCISQHPDIGQCCGLCIDEHNEAKKATERRLAEAQAHQEAMDATEKLAEEVFNKSVGGSIESIETAEMAAQIVRAALPEHLGKPPYHVRTFGAGYAVCFMRDGLPHRLAMFYRKDWGDHVQVKAHQLAGVLNGTMEPLSHSDPSAPDQLYRKRT